jgi:4-hydroxymandelate oxidase
MTRWYAAEHPLTARVEAAARALLPAVHYDVVAGGAGAETAARRNTRDWESLRLRPHVLRDVREVSTTTSCLGAEVATPVLVAPMGCQELMHPEAERGTSRGAAAAGSLMVVAERAATALEDVAAVGDAPRWFQVYLQDDVRYTARLVDRAVASGYRAVVMTVDAPRPALRLRDRGHGFSSRSLTKGNVRGQGDLTYVDPLNANLTFDRLDWLVGHSPLPVVVKGVLRADDAAAAVDRGAAAVVVSNHGGRQLSAPARVTEALLEVVAAVGDRAEVYVDSGLRSGEHVLKALALGATGVLLGRPVLYALSAGGGEGVRQLLESLTDELRQAMALCGVRSLDQLQADLVVTGGQR